MARVRIKSYRNFVGHKVKVYLTLYVTCKLPLHNRVNKSNRRKYAIPFYMDCQIFNDYDFSIWKRIFLMKHGVTKDQLLFYVSITQNEFYELLKWITFVIYAAYSFSFNNRLSLCQEWCRYNHPAFWVQFLRHGWHVSHPVMVIMHQMPVVSTYVYLFVDVTLQRIYRNFTT